MISPVRNHTRQKPKRNCDDPAVVRQSHTDLRLPGPKLDQAVVFAFLTDAFAHLANAFDRMSKLAPILEEIQQALEAYVTETGKHEKSRPAPSGRPHKVKLIPAREPRSLASTIGATLPEGVPCQAQ